MPIEQAKVTKANPDTAWVQVTRSQMCENCSSQESCMIINTNEMEIEVANSLGVKQGDRVIISMPSSSILHLSILVYIVPIIFMIIGAIIGQKIGLIFNIDLTICSIVTSFLFLAITFYIIRKLSPKIAKKSQYRPIITKVIR